ncbi:hypothetical protein GGR55DRAFT_674631 [Xylaria sp. FL0064]|nr:hypothetical protein GGR55DRAFT_674631 [Xylaria sp. FL0064]
MPTITLLRGFKVPVTVLDAFLRANNVDDTHGMSPLPDDDQAISALLRDKMGEGAGSARVFIPHREAFSPATLAYVAFCWLHVFVQREVKLEDDLPEIPPSGFFRLKDEIFSFGDATEVRDRESSSLGAIGIHIVYTDNRGWTPQVLYDRIKVKTPIHCDQCDAVFEDFPERQVHRMDAHGCCEGTNPLPEI